MLALICFIDYAGCMLVVAKFKYCSVYNSQLAALISSAMKTFHISWEAGPRAETKGTADAEGQFSCMGIHIATV